MRISILETETSKLKEYTLIIIYFISLFSSTCFFYDPKFIKIGTSLVAIPVGLLFFPITFAACNILQDQLGKRTANSLVISAFIGDTLLIVYCYIIAYLGDRGDYKSVFFGLPSIMAASWLFMVVTSIFNIWLYEALKKWQDGSLMRLTIRFFLTITLTEILTSALSMPLMLYRHGINKTIILTIIMVVIYKLVANIGLSTFYLYFELYRQKIRHATVKTNICSG